MFVALHQRETREEIERKEFKRKMTLKPNVVERKRKKDRDR